MSDFYAVDGSPMTGVRPETRYAKSGDLHVAYQVFGEGDIDLIVTPGAVSHLELQWEDPAFARYHRRLGLFARVVIFDKRGTGLSDRVTGVPILEERMDDVRAVMDAVGLERAALMGASEGVPMSLLFAATYPDRTTALIVFGGMVAGSWKEDLPWLQPEEPEEFEQHLRRVIDDWGRGPGLETLAPSAAGNPAWKELWGRIERAGASPAAFEALARMNRRIDVREILPAIAVPTLVLHRREDRACSIEEGQYLARHIPGARLVELGGEDHFPWEGDAEAIIAEIQEFLTGVRGVPEPERALVTILFTDIVGSTDMAVRLGDREWERLLDRHHQLVRRQISGFQGQEVATLGDGFLAAFDGPARAIRVGLAIVETLPTLGLQARVGIHTGECEVRGTELTGLAVHIGARVVELAEAGEVLVSRTVRDLVAGSEIVFADRGAHQLKGVPGEWHLYAVLPNT